MMRCSQNSVEGRARACITFAKRRESAHSTIGRRHLFTQRLHHHGSSAGGSEHSPLRSSIRWCCVAQCKGFCMAMCHFCRVELKKRLGCRWFLGFLVASRWLPAGVLVAKSNTDRRWRGWELACSSNTLGDTYVAPGWASTVAKLSNCHTFTHFTAPCARTACSEIECSLVRPECVPDLSEWGPRTWGAPPSSTSHHFRMATSLASVPALGAQANTIAANVGRRLKNGRTATKYGQTLC